MNRLRIGGIPALALASSIAFPAVVAAQDNTEVLEPQFFVWLDDPLKGVVIAIAALLGTLFVVFTSIGGLLPGTQGKAKLDADQARLDAYYARFDDVLKGDNTKQLTALGDQIDKLRDDIRADRRSQFGLGAVIYVLLGVAVALALATSWLQAVVISAGWTAYIGTFGLKSDYIARKEAKDEAIAVLNEKVAAAPEVVLTQQESTQVDLATAL